MRGLWTYNKPQIKVTKPVVRKMERKQTAGRKQDSWSVPSDSRLPAGQVTRGEWRQEENEFAGDD